LLGLVGHAFLYDYVVDDAFISFRYAQNLVGGEGLVYNPGERVEGYTNFLWVMLTALGMALGADPVPFSKVLGLLSAAGVLALTFGWPGNGIGRGGVLRLLAPALLCLSPPFALWSVGGLETCGFTLLVFTALTASIRMDRAGEHRAKWEGCCGFCLALAILTRPEGWIAALLVVLDRVFGAAREGKTVGRFPVVLVAVCLAAVLPHQIWKWSYYGHPFPNSYYAKVGWTGAQGLRGLTYLGGFTRGFGWPVISLALVGLAGGFKERAVRLLYLWTVLYVAYVVIVGGDGLCMYRFFVPILPALCLLAERGVRVLSRMAAGSFPGARRWARVSLCALLCAALGLLTVKPSIASKEKEFVRQDKQFVMHWITIGKWLRHYARPDDRIAVTTAGAVPYYSGLYAIDMLGINEPVIAHRKMPGMGEGIAGHEKYDMAYVVDRRPTYLFHHLFLLTKAKFTREQFETPWNPGEEDLLRSEEFKRVYEPVSEQVNGFYINFFRLRETGQGEAE